jgi:hypothetical protein
MEKPFALVWLPGWQVSGYERSGKINLPGCGRTPFLRSVHACNDLSIHLSTQFESSAQWRPCPIAAQVVSALASWRGAILRYEQT